MFIYHLYTKRRRSTSDVKLSLATRDIKENPGYNIIYKRIGSHYVTLQNIQEDILCDENVETYDMNMYMSDSYSGLYRETIVYAKTIKDDSIVFLKHRLLAIIENSDDKVFLQQLLNSFKGE